MEEWRVLLWLGLSVLMLLLRMNSEGGDDEAGRPRGHRGGVDDGEDAERGERVGHQPVNEPEPHPATPCAVSGAEGRSSAPSAFWR